MNIEPLFKKFDELADAPDRIPRLRKVILAYLLHSAVSSPDAITRAATLRDAHEIRRHELIKNASRKEVPKVPDVTDEDLPPSLSDIPTALFDRLGNVASIEKGLSQIQSTKPGKYPLVVTAETRSSSESFDFEGAAAIIPLVSSTGHGDASLKRLHYQEGRYAVGNILAVVNPICPDLLRARFIYEYLSAFKEELLVSRMVGTANVSLTVNKLKEVPVPLVSGPVLSRIDELMALCDRLEAQQQERETRHAALARASLARFADAPTPVNLHFLFHPSYSIPPADLRKSILTLAVQGKLVPQDPNDEPAEELFARIESTKDRLIKQRAVKRVAVDTNPIGDACEPLPPGWLWTRLGNSFDVRDGTHDTPKYTTEGFPLITSKNIYSGSLLFDGANLISEKDHRQISERSRVGRGDILFAMIGSIGNPVIVDTDREFSIKNVALFKYYTAADSEPRFLLLYLKLVAEEMKAKAAGGVQSFVSLGFLRNYPFPLPPLAEQRRIVAKVDQLTALVDGLEMQVAASRATASSLLEAIVAELTGATQNSPAERQKAA